MMPMHLYRRQNFLKHSSVLLIVFLDLRPFVNGMLQALAHERRKLSIVTEYEKRLV